MIKLDLLNILLYSLETLIIIFIPLNFRGRSISFNEFLTMILLNATKKYFLFYGDNLLIIHLSASSLKIILSCNLFGLPCQNSNELGFILIPPQFSGLFGDFFL